MESTSMCRKVISFIYIAALLFCSGIILGQDNIDRVGHQNIVRYLVEMDLIKDLDRVTVWTTPYVLDQTHITRHLIKEKNEDIPFPFEKNWLVMIDDYPDANFGHPVRWLFINGDFTEHSEVFSKQFPPIVLSDFGRGKPVPFRCWDLTGYQCIERVVLYEPQVTLKKVPEKNCRNAVLVSGGANSGSNFGRYAQNLKSMYSLLRNAGYPAAHIFVYYADGTLPLDCDNADGDDNDNTGNDVTDGAYQDTIRAKIQNLCSTLNRKRDVLFTYFTNHGSDNNGACLWDFAGDGLGNDEIYSPAELSDDVEDCEVCRHFMIHDQCFSGEFLPIATDGDHDNLVVYAAASASESSFGRQYMAQWEQNDITSVTVNAMHQDVVTNGNLTSTPGMSEGTTDIGDRLAGNCCIWWWLWKYWYIVLVAIVIVGYYIRKRTFK